MRKDGSLTKREERTVLRAIAIMGEWVREHAYDERRPWTWDSIAHCAHQLECDAWAMFDAA